MPRHISGTSAPARGVYLLPWGELPAQTIDVVNAQKIGGEDGGGPNLSVL